MTIFEDHEIRVVELLTQAVLNDEIRTDLFNKAELIEYSHSTAGYFLTVRSDSLPNERIVISKPLVIGEIDGVECGFIIFIERGQLMLECHSWGDACLPDDLRDLSISIRVDDNR